MIVYIESIFLDNFLPNTLLLYLASPLRKKHRLTRSLAGGGFGGLYAVLSAYFPTLSAFWFKIPAGVVMCIIGYGFRNRLFRGCLSFFAVSFLMGGINLALMYATSMPSSSIQASQRVLLGAALLTVSLITLLKRLRPQPITEPLSITFHWNGEQLRFTAEYDSGMDLRDESGNSVILLNKDYARKHLSQEAFHTLLKGADRPFHIRTATGSETLMGLRIRQLLVEISGISYQADAYIILADHICLNHSPALYGNGFHPEEINP